SVYVGRTSALHGTTPDISEVRLGFKLKALSSRDVTGIMRYSVIAARPLTRHVLAPALDILRGTHAMRSFLELEETQWWPRERIDRLQSERLQRLVHHAYERVPYYRAVMEELGVRPESISTPADLSLLPVLTKADVRAHSSHLLARGFPHKELLLGQTGGSTGTPLTFYSSRQARWSNGTGRSLRALTWAGVYPGDSTVIIAKRHRPGPVRTPPFHRIVGLVTGETLEDCTTLSDATLPGVVQRLARQRPRALRGYASAMCIIADFIRESGMPVPETGAIVVGGEQLFDEQRALLREVFELEPFSKYSSFENYDIAMECESHSGMHVAAEDLIVEIVDDEGHPVPPGTEGRLLVTNLHEYGMPLTRYDTDDQSSFATGSCECGRSLPRLRAVTGKTGNTIYTASGRRISPLALSSSSLAGLDIRQFQFVQEQLDRVTVKIVPETDLDRDTRACLCKTIEAHYRSILGDEMRVDVVIVGGIEPTPAGKHLFLISKVKRPHPMEPGTVHSH
ncbi:MAG: phenylacetate--CoA ligase family protein, partial [Chloroflexota bacterium]